MTVMRVQLSTDCSLQLYLSAVEEVDKVRGVSSLPPAAGSAFRGGEAVGNQSMNELRRLRSLRTHNGQRAPF